jgi:hypothetical protein
MPGQKKPVHIRLPRNVVRQLRLTARIADVELGEVLRAALLWWATLDTDTKLLLVSQSHYHPTTSEPVQRPGLWARLGRSRIARGLRWLLNGRGPNWLYPAGRAASGLAPAPGGKQRAYDLRGRPLGTPPSTDFTAKD